MLLDYLPPGEDLPNEIRGLLENEREKITDLHVWRLGPGHHGAIVSILSAEPKPPAHYRDKLAQIHDLSHVTIEVEPSAA